MPDNYIGMNIHLPGLDVLEKVDEANIAWVRCDFDWSRIEKDRGVFDYSDTDRVVNFCEQRGIQILPVIGYTPEWASWDGKRTSPPRSYVLWERFVTNIVRRYAGYVKHWAIWNEPNSPNFWTGGMMTYYSMILGSAYRATQKLSYELGVHLHIVAPNVAASDSLPNWPEWLEYALKWPSSVIDIVSYHCYASSGKKVADYIKHGRWPSFLRWLQPILDRRYPHKQAISKVLQPFFGTHKIWMTETGWSTHVMSEAEQKQNYKDLYNEYFPYSSLDRIFFYEMKDDINFPPRSGVLKSNLTHKMTYDWLKGS